MSHGPSQTSPSRPDWLKVKIPHGAKYLQLRQLLKEQNLVTVCQEALCPNIQECWDGGTATFMLMGDTCTRACRFCSVKTGNPMGVLDREEPQKIGYAISQMKLSYVVLTSVDRDDLDDFGADHFATTIEMIKKNKPEMLVECLTPDFEAIPQLVQRVLDAKPDVFAHNIETVERLSPTVRDRRAKYRQSLETLALAKVFNPEQITKTSIMLGLGETKQEIKQSLLDLREVSCDVVTFGQYLAPTDQHKKYLPVVEYIHPDIFKSYQKMAEDLGFLYVASGPLVRSSYKAGEYFIASVIKERQHKNSWLKKRLQ
ncbi:MAG: lipoyl synthase [Halobacteriovoraceae bacterium]|jgi:lipoyl synthase|nr:lipoyl synthase [Halobacteriovoraceae bacterium]MBT5095015.1 lipoyl synthase [Halobacteriovoraceae bacterium]